MKNTKQEREVLKRISLALNDQVRLDTNAGLLTGYCGTALFFAYYYQLTGNKRHLKTLHNIIEKAVIALSEEDMIYSHCSGVSGILWNIQHLMKLDFIQHDETENIFAEADKLLLEYMTRQLNEKQYDFLHAGLGTALYFLNRMPNHDVTNYLTAVVQQLETISIRVREGITWKDCFSKKTEEDQSEMYNLGLAHGVPAILAILSMFYEKGITSALPLIQQGVQWLLSTKNEHENISLYPTMVSTNNKAIGTSQSRLGWCYGDLGIASCLWGIGKRLQVENYKDEAFTIFRHIIKHRNKDNGNIYDASLCHGSIGVSHILRRMHADTGDQLFLDGSNKWLSQTLQFGSGQNACAGYKYLANDGYQDNYNLLEGIAGIGLGLIAAVDSSHAPDWDRCLLLS